jgi:hypothetical protein
MPDGRPGHLSAPKAALDCFELSMTRLRPIDFGHLWNNMKSHRLLPSLVVASLLLAGSAFAAADTATAAKDADKACCAKGAGKTCCAKDSGADAKCADQKDCKCGSKGDCKDPAASKSAPADTKGSQDKCDTSSAGGK